MLIYGFVIINHIIDDPHEFITGFCCTIPFLLPVTGSNKNIRMVFDLAVIYGVVYLQENIPI
jgi:hypothetical protein